MAVGEMWCGEGHSACLSSAWRKEAEREQQRVGGPQDVSAGDRDMVLQVWPSYEIVVGRALFRKRNVLHCYSILCTKRG